MSMAGLESVDTDAEPKGDVELIGARLRERRRALRLSLRAAAERIGLTAGFLSQVERDEVSPSITSLRKIANGLQVSIFYFLNGTERAVVRSDQRAILRLPQSKLEYELLTPRSSPNLEVFVCRMEPGAASCDEPWGHPGEECIVVLEGQMRLELGSEVHVLGAGDSIFFDASVPHRSVALGGEQLVAIACVTPAYF